MNTLVPGSVLTIFKFQFAVVHEIRSTLGRFLCGFFFFDSIWVFQPIVDVLRPHSSWEWSHLSDAKTRLSIGAVRIIAEWAKSDNKSEVAPNPKIGLFSNEGQLQIIFSSDYARGKNSNYASGDVDFWAGYFSERLWIGPESAWLIPSFFRFKTNVNATKVKSNGTKSDSHRNRR